MTPSGTLPPGLDGLCIKSLTVLRQILHSLRNDGRLVLGVQKGERRRVVPVVSHWRFWTKTKSEAVCQESRRAELYLDGSALPGDAVKSRYLLSESRINGLKRGTTFGRSIRKSTTSVPSEISPCFLEDKPKSLQTKSWVQM